MQPSEPSETLAALPPAALASLPPFSPVPLVAGTVAKPPTSDGSVPDEQQFLFHLLHAKACVHTCTVMMCKESKKLLQHVDSCQDQSCRFRDCYKAKMALLHYQRCSTGIGCKECGTVRTVASDAAKRGADFATMTLYDLTRTYRYNLQVSTWAPQRQLRRQSLDLSSVNFFYEKNIESIFIVKEGINDPLSLLSQQLVRPEFSNFVAKNGINECSVQINHHLNQDSPIYQHFIREGRACCTANGTKHDMSVCIVFHGTPEENVEGIMQHGLNPAFRNRQAFGSGEYFAPDPSYPLSYCNGGRKIIVFAVLANAENIKANQIVVVENINRQLPIAVLSFDYVNINRRAWMAAGQFQGLLSQLQKEKEEKEQVAKLAKQKSTIIQLLIQGERLAASELYEKACVVGIPPPAWSKELSVYVHDHIRDDELVHALFPNLPPRPAESASTLDVLNVDKCEAEAKTATQKYEAAKMGRDERIPAAAAAPTSPAPAAAVCCVPPSGPVRAHALRLRPGAPLMESLRTAADVVLARIPATKCSAAFVLTAVGSLSEATLRLANASKKDRSEESAGARGTSVKGGGEAAGGEVLGKDGGNDIRRWERRFEIVSLVGTFSRDGGCHLHISLSDAEGNTIGGHLIDGTVFTTLEIVLGTAEGVEFRRCLDEETGYRELVPWQLEKEDENSWGRRLRRNATVLLGVILGFSMGVAFSSRRKL